MTVIDSLVRGYRDSLTVVPYRDGDLVSLPTTFASGAMLTVYVTTEGGVASITDRGLTADELTDAGVDLSTPRALRSFEAVRDSTGLPPAFGAESWEISVALDVPDLAIGIQAIADAAMRADGLRVLSRSTRAASFADVSIDRVSARTAVVPRAHMPGRLGEHRQVTLSYAGRDEHSYYVQALAARDSDARGRSYDHASGLFLDAAPEIKYRVALLQEGRWESWRVQALSQVCRVVDERDVDDFVSSTALVA